MSNLQLLSKINIGGQKLANRIVLAPMTRARYVPLMGLETTEYGCRKNTDSHQICLLFHFSDALRQKIL